MLSQHGHIGALQIVVIIIKANITKAQVVCRRSMQGYILTDTGCRVIALDSQLKENSESAVKFCSIFRLFRSVDLRPRSSMMLTAEINK